MSQIDAKSANALNKALKESPVDAKDRNQAWEIMRESGLEPALQYLASAKKQIVLKDPAPYQVWGKEGIEEGALDQMRAASMVPVSVAGALMPDAHLGYGLPIGGVLATDNAVIPYAVGVDIACRMRLTVFDANETDLHKRSDLMKKALVEQTRFGAGAIFLPSNRSQHPVLDHPDWKATPLLERLHSLAVEQLGSSGGGNHFVEWGLFTLDEGDETLGIDDPGTYLALLSHSGSRGVGFKIANYYSKLAQEQRPGLPKEVEHLAWFTLDEEAGHEYWLSMQLAGEFASANHAVIHNRITGTTGLTPIATVENHHNFAWEEKVNGQNVIVHRKGATPAGKGVLGVIPGSMGDPGFVVKGKGNSESLNSASHGAGRRMSRRQANKTITRKEQLDYLKKLDVKLIGGGLDEAAQAYKRIEEVMAAQADLIEVVGKFEPKIVRMADDGSSDD
jgi:tRNA-splicing ligase RtcB